MLEHMASTWNPEKSQISSGLKWSRPSGRIRRNKLGYYSGLAMLPNDVAIAWGTRASVGKAKKKKKQEGWELIPSKSGCSWVGIFQFFLTGELVGCSQCDVVIWICAIEGAQRHQTAFYWLSFRVAPRTLQLTPSRHAASLYSPSRAFDGIK